jgi:hypothetical protein
MGDGALIGSQQPNTDRATRRAEKRGDMRFVPERRRSRRAARRDPRGASASGWCCVDGIHGRLTIPICRELLDLKAEPTKRSGSG